MHLTHATLDAFEIALFQSVTLHAACKQTANREMADDFVLNSILSAFLDDYHEIPSDLDASSLSQKEIESQVNRANVIVVLLLTVRCCGRDRRVLRRYCQRRSV